MSEKIGKVYIVGAGPGNPYLVSLKAVECLKCADVVIYDHLVGERILAYIPENAEKIYAGKKEGVYTLSQEEINTLLCEKSLQNKVVVRLKGGDPFVFGRGAEECLELAKHNIPYEIVPGITSATAVPAYAGIPLTHRDVSSSIHIITGHETQEKEKSTINWEALAKVQGTLVFLMGISNLSIIVNSLIANGLSPETPIAIIMNGTTPRQKTVVSLLKDIIEDAKKVTISPPGVIVIGECVKYREVINWYEKKPLFGKRIVVTRPLKQNCSFVDALQNEGALVYVCPTIKITPIDSNKLLSNFTHISGYNWIIFTSTNGVSIFFQELFKSGRDVRSLGNIRVAAIGEATANSIKEYSITPDFIPTKYHSESLVKEIPVADGEKILFPCSSESRDIIPKELENRKCSIDCAEIYKTEPGREGISKIKNLIKFNEIDIITFTSPTTVKFLIDDLNEVEYQYIKRIKIASIGAVTTAILKEYGFQNIIESPIFTTSSLSETIIQAESK